MKRTLKELDSAYRQWLSEDVTYIISPTSATLSFNWTPTKSANNSSSSSGCAQHNPDLRKRF